MIGSLKTVERSLKTFYASTFLTLAQNIIFHRLILDSAKKLDHDVINSVPARNGRLM